MKDCVGRNGGGFFGCFVVQLVTWNGRMTRDLLNENGRQDGVNEIGQIEEVPGFVEMRASHNALLSVQQYSD